MPAVGRLWPSDDDDRDNMLQDDETGVKSSGECDVQVKGNYETVGVSAEVKVGDCAAQQVLCKLREAIVSKKCSFFLTLFKRPLTPPPFHLNICPILQGVFFKTRFCRE